MGANQHSRDIIFENDELVDSLIEGKFIVLEPNEYVEATFHGPHREKPFGDHHFTVRICERLWD
jgi:hypothetical protein